MDSLKDWFHSIDLGDGLVTPGRSGHRLWRANRCLMDSIDFKGKSVLEIGSCEGMFAFEAEKRGAAYVVATDLMPYALDRFQFCKRALGSRVVPFFNTSVYELSHWVPQMLRGLPADYLGSRDKFDIVICFGVLYHLRDPMLALAQIRTALKETGTALIETATVRSRRSIMEFNTDGNRFYRDVTTWWAASFSCLKAMCRASALRVVPGSVPWSYTLMRLHRTGRIGFVARPIDPSNFGHEYLFALRTHYPEAILPFLRDTTS